MLYIITAFLNRYSSNNAKQIFKNDKVAQNMLQDNSYFSYVLNLWYPLLYFGNGLKYRLNSFFNSRFSFQILYLRKKQDELSSYNNIGYIKMAKKIRLEKSCCCYYFHFLSCYMNLYNQFYMNIKCFWLSRICFLTLFINSLFSPLTIL